jgi:hypothetical protein
LQLACELELPEEDALVKKARSLCAARVSELSKNYENKNKKTGRFLTDIKGQLARLDPQVNQL